VLLVLLSVKIRPILAVLPRLPLESGRELLLRYNLLCAV
jgi:hypothetical protein